MEGGSTNIVVNALTGLSDELGAVGTVALAAGVLALTIWAGFRLGAKLTNRGVGK